MPTSYRPHVQELLDRTKAQIEKALQKYVSCPNDTITRARIRDEAIGLLSSLDVKEYKVVCDCSNNTSRDVDMGNINIDISVRPTASSGTFKINAARHDNRVWMIFPHPEMWP